MGPLPTGFIAFLLTDIEGSTLLWEQAPDAMADALAHHGRIVEDAVAAHGGVLIRERGEGDSTFSVYTGAADAIAAAAQMQRELHATDWPPGAEIRVRAAVNAGDVQIVNGEYEAPVINRCARIREIAWGGQALVSEAAAEHADGHTLTDLGPHRMRDLEHPVRIFQICGDGLPDDFPALRSLEGGKHNLPVQLTSFVGRERELDAIAKAIGENRLVTLTGPGGVGKTRLALQTAARAAEGYPDGVWLAELAHIDAGELVPRVLLDALCLREQPGRTIERTLTDHLARRRALLVLDNCEHVVDTATALAVSLLRSCPEVDILATAREAVPVPGATAWPVPPLELPDDDDTTEALSTTESVRLFCDRVALVRSDFALSNDNAPVVARLCRRLDGVPLAIELAAAAVRTMSPAELEAQLADRIALGSEQGRHGTLDSAVAWSHDLLTRDERALFRRLAVFAGGFDAEAAGAVCSGRGLEATDAPKLLSRLVGQSLVTAEAGEHTRYRLLQVIRAFASDRLDDAGERVATGARHAEHFCGLAKQIHLHLQGPDQGRLLDRLESEMPNFRAALTRAIDDGSHLALSMTASLGELWRLRGHHSEGMDWMGRAIEATGAPVTPDHARTLISAALLCADLGTYDEAVDHLTTSLGIWRVLGDSIGVVNANQILGGVAHRLGDTDRAETCFAEAVTLARRNGDDRRLVGALDGLAYAAYARGRYADALTAYDEATEICRREGLRRNLAGTLINAARAKRASGDIAGGRAYLDEVVDIAREIGDRILEAEAVNQLGELARDEQDYAEARARFEEVRRICAQVDSPVTLAGAISHLGELTRLEGRVAEAVDILTEALSYWERIGQSQARSVVLEQRGAARIVLGHLTEAHADLVAALEQAIDIGYVPGQPIALDDLADLYVAAGDPALAARLVGASSALYEQMGRGGTDLQPHERPAILERVRGACADHEALVDEGRALSATDALDLVRTKRPVPRRAG